MRTYKRKTTRDPTNQNQSLVTEPPVENEVNVADDLSLNLENPRDLNDVPNLEISVTEVIAQMSNEPVAGPSGIQKNNDFSVETIRPLPKAPPRAQSNRKRTKKSAILTDSPEMNALEEEHHIRELKKRKTTAKDQNKGNNDRKDKGKGKSKGKSKAKGEIKTTDEKVKKVKKRISDESSDSEGDEYFCIVCGVSYNEDASGGDWIQCISCKQWAQSGCINGDTTLFTCLNCESDDNVPLSTSSRDVV